MVDAVGEQAFSWDRKLSEEDLLESRGRSEPRGSTEQPPVVIPPSLPTMSPTRSLREEAPASAPAVPAGILANLDRQSILDWLDQTQAGGSAPRSVPPVDADTEDHDAVEDGEIREEPTVSQESPNLDNRTEDTSSVRSSMNSDCYPGLDRFKEHLSESSEESDADTEDLESDEEGLEVLPQDAGRLELPLPLKDDGRPSPSADAPVLPSPIEEEVASVVVDGTPEDSANSGYDLTAEERAMGIETFMVAPQPVREWRVLAFPWAVEGESEDGRKGIKHQATGFFFPEALYHTKSKGVEDLICASSVGMKSPLFMRVLSSLPLPRVSDKEKECRRKARISGEVLDLVLADGSFSKALGWSALDDFSGVEIERVTEHLTDVFRNQSSPPRSHSASFAIKGKKDFTKALLDSIFGPSKKEFSSYGSHLGNFLGDKKLSLDKVEEARKALEPNARALLCNEAIRNVARHASESVDLKGLSKEAMARLLRHIVAFSEEIAGAIEPQTSAQALKFLAAKKAVRDQVLQGVGPRRIRQALDECSLLDPDVFPKVAFGEVEEIVVRDNVDLYRSKASGSHTFKRPLSPLASKSSAKAQKLGNGGKHFPKSVTKPKVNASPTTVPKPAQPSGSQSFRPGRGKQSPAVSNHRGSGQPRGGAQHAGTYGHQSGGSRNRSRPLPPFAGGRGGFTSKFALRREQ